MDLSVLRTSKAALDEGLIDANDFQAVKNSFVKAQSIKAGLDAGFITDADLSEARSEFFRAMGVPLSSSGSFSQSLDGLRPPAPTPAAAPAPATAPAPAAARRLPPPASINTAPAAPAQREIPTASIANSSHPIQLDDNRWQPTLPVAGTGNGSSSAPPSEAAPSLPETPRSIGDHGGAVATAGKASMSGIKVHPDSVNVVGEMRIRKKYRWIAFKIGQAGKQVEVDRCGGPKSTYGEFMAAMPSDECRYGVYDYEYRNSEGTVYGKLVFVSWAPEIATTKAKMQHASTKDFFRGFLDGISVELHATEPDELDEDHLRERVANTVARK